MDEKKQNLKGSPKRDTFKRKHKDINKKFYASDADLCLISFNPRGVVAYLDYKGSGENITSTESVLYDEWMLQAPMYIVEGEEPEKGPFTIWRYLGSGSDLEYVTFVSDWSGYEEWENGLRQEYKRRNGWNGNLRNE